KPRGVCGWWNFSVRANSRPHMPSRLIVVSNRLPLTLRKTEGGWATERSSGGLATAMNPLLQKNGGIWIGWPGGGIENDEKERRSILQNWEQTERWISI